MTPSECRTREDIRREIDELDRALIDLLVERFAYIRRMAEIKQDPSEARNDARVSDVLDKVTVLARQRDFDVGLARQLWTLLMDWNIEWERQAIAAHKRQGSK